MTYRGDATVGHHLEGELFRGGRNAYYFGLSNLAGSLDAAIAGSDQLASGDTRDETRDEQIRHLGEVAHILTDAGQIVITTVADLDLHEAETLRILESAQRHAGDPHGSGSARRECRFGPAAETDPGSGSGRGVPDAARARGGARVLPVSVSGFVSLIGAGPGDPELITVRGQRALAAAEVIIYDDLVDRHILTPYAGRILHGLGDRRTPSRERQQRLHALLAAEAGAGRRIAHLKGGDPLLQFHYAPPVPSAPARTSA